MRQPGQRADLAHEPLEVLADLGQPELLVAQRDHLDAVELQCASSAPAERSPALEHLGGRALAPPPSARPAARASSGARRRDHQLGLLEASGELGVAAKSASASSRRHSSSSAIARQACALGQRAGVGRARRAARAARRPALEPELRPRPGASARTARRQRGRPAPRRSPSAAGHGDRLARPASAPRLLGVRRVVEHGAEPRQHRARSGASSPGSASSASLEQRDARRRPRCRSAPRRRRRGRARPGEAASPRPPRARRSAARAYVLAASSQRPARQTAPASAQQQPGALGPRRRARRARARRARRASSSTASS